MNNELRNLAKIQSVNKINLSPETLRQILEASGWMSLIKVRVDDCLAGDGTWQLVMSESNRCSIVGNRMVDKKSYTHIRAGREPAKERLHDVYMTSICAVKDK